MRLSYTVKPHAIISKLAWAEKIDNFSFKKSSPVLNGKFVVQADKNWNE